MSSEDERGIIETRLEERFDEPRLRQYLRGRVAGAEGQLTVKQFAGGKANLTYLLRFDGEREYVLRRPPLGPYAPSAHDMGRENRVLSVLPSAFPFAPRVYHFCDDESVIGAPFLIMERCHGVVVRESMPPAYASLPEAPGKMSGALVDALAAFHAVDYADLGLQRLGRPAGFVERQVAGWWRRWGASRLGDSPDVGPIHRWLERNLPRTDQSSLVHNDPKLDNTMFATRDPGRVIAILDWDMCTLGDPLSDLGALLTYWTQPDDPPLVQAIATMPAGERGFFTRRQLLERYARSSGRDVSNMRFYHVLGIFRLLVILQQIYFRFAGGHTRDQRFATLGESVGALAEWAREVAAGA